MNRFIKTLHLCLCQGVLNAVNLGISAYSVYVYARNRTTGAPDSLNFLLFMSCFSLVSLLYLGPVPRLAPRAAPGYACLAIEIFNTVLYLGALIAYAYFLGNLTICSGWLCAVNRANSVVAAVAFCAWIGSRRPVRQGFDDCPRRRLAPLDHRHRRQGCAHAAVCLSL